MLFKLRLLATGDTSIIAGPTGITIINMTTIITTTTTTTTLGGTCARSSQHPRRTFKLTALGILAGLIAAFFLSRFLSSILFGITTHDAITFIAVPLCLIAIALLAGYLPARRATRVDPVTSLRYE